VTARRAIPVATGAICVAFGFDRVHLHKSFRDAVYGPYAKP
jgi:hypothetical protein